MIQAKESNSNEGIKKLWEYPWKYAESFIVAIEILIAGIIVEAVSGGRGMTIPGLPLNIYIIFIFAATLLFLYIKYKESPITTWISSIPAAISSICIYAFLVLLLGFIPQNTDESSVFLNYTGLSHIKSSWPFILIQFYLLTALGMITIKRAIPFKKKNIGFLMNHFGLWLTLLAAGLGSADLSRLNINLIENENANDVAVAQNGALYKMPFSLKLIDFNVVQYDPKLALVDIETNKYIMDKGKTLPFATKNSVSEMSNWKITVNELVSQSIIENNRIVESDTIGSNPAALIITTNTTSGDTVKGWITSGSFLADPKYLILNDKEVLVLTQPDPKRYSSEIIVYSDDNTPDTVTLEVNKPYSVSGWKIYQSGYDEKKGKWSNLSIIEAVHDPWLPVVYIGIALLLCGSLYLFWIGKDKKEKTF